MARHNKQHDARGASFRRIAKDIREIGRKSANPEVRDFARNLAKHVFDAEAMRLRAMR